MKDPLRTDGADFEDFLKRNVERKRVTNTEKLNAAVAKGSSVAREKLPVARLVT